MEITGKFVKALNPLSGEGKNGTWKKQEFVIEIPGDFPKKVCFVNWNDKVNLSGLSEGDEVTVRFDVESREFNERWYTDVKAWGLEKSSAQAGTSSAGDSAPPPSLGDMPPDDGDDDLPF